MSKIYLQEKIIGSSGQFMAIKNGVPTGIDAAFGVSPIIEVTAPSNTGRIVCSKDLVILEVEPVPISGTANSKWTFNPTSYGIWTISAVEVVGGNDTYLFADSVDVTEAITYTLEISSSDFVSKILGNNSWAKIKKVAQSMRGSSYWAIGDSKGVPISNSSSITGLDSGTTLINDTYLACIIGFNHNTQLEGSGLIHFQLYLKVENAHTNNMAWFGFKYNSTNTVAGGWASSYLRNTMFGTSLSQTNCLLNCFNSNLRSALAPVIKYTDNEGDGTSFDRNISQTIDYLFQPSLKEVFGDISFDNINQYEKNYQQQYEYYTNANNRIGTNNIIRFHYISGSYQTAYTLLRSVSLNPNILEIRNSDSTAYTEDESSGAATVRDVCPCFCVGKNSLLD